eukprot:3875825-Pyramimonas_sp.AAC.1
MTRVGRVDILNGCVNPRDSGFIARRWLAYHAVFLAWAAGRTKYTNGRVSGQDSRVDSPPVTVSHSFLGHSMSEHRRIILLAFISFKGRQWKTVEYLLSRPSLEMAGLPSLPSRRGHKKKDAGQKVSAQPQSEVRTVLHSKRVGWGQGN